jgi:glycosyltransferase 2 family protein
MTVGQRASSPGTQEPEPDRTGTAALPLGAPAVDPPDDATDAPSEKKRSGRLGLAIKLGITVGVTAYVLWQAGLTEALRTLAGADWRLVLLAALSALVSMTINVKRWQVMLHGQGGEASLPTLIRLYLIAMFFNNILPSRFAGDVVRAYGASIRLTTKTRSAAAVIMDRLVGAISVLLLGVIAMVVSPSVIPWQLSQTLVLGLAVGLTVVGLLVVRTPLQGTMRGLLGLAGRLPVVGRFLGKRVNAAADAVLAYSGKPGLIAWALVVSMLANGLSIMNIYLYALAVGANVSLANAAVVAPVVLAVGLLPISLNGLGTIELTFVLLLGLMGVEPELALAVALLRRLVLLGQSLIGGVLYSARRFG